MHILHCRWVGNVPILRLILLAFLRLRERELKLRRMGSGRSMRGGIMEELGLFNHARIMLGSQ